MRSRNSSAGLCVLLAVVASAQQPPSAAPTDQKPASIEGVVLNALTGEPLMRAHVMVDGFAGGKQQQYGAMSNAEGKFSVTGLAAGMYGFMVEKTAFIAPIENGRRGTQVSLKPGESRSDVKLKLTPTGAILGRVTDTDGNPVENASVYADLGGMGGRRGSAMTDEKGNFRIGGLEPGRYRIRASLASLPFPPEIRTDGSVEPHFVPTYHPDSLDSKGATRIPVKSGADVTGVDVKLRRTPFVRISGIITGIPEGSQAQVGLELRDETGGTRRMNVVGTDGKFEYWNMDPGKWLVSGVLNSQDQMLRSAPVEVEMGEQNVDNLELRMVAPFEVTGQIEFTDESAKPKAPTGGGMPPRFALQEATRVGRVSGTAAIPFTPDGTFKFANVPPGKYRFNFGWRASIKSIRLGTVEMEDGVIDLRLGAGSAPLTVVMAPATAEISGVVRDEKGPVAGATVVLRNSAIGIGSTNSFFSAPTGADGSYRLANVPTGKFVLVAVDEGDSSLMNDNFEDYDDVLENVTVLGDEKMVKDLKRHPRRN